MPGRLLFLLIAILGVVYVRYSWIRIENEQFENSLQISRSIAATLPKEELRALEAKPDDIYKPEYQVIKNTLKAIIHANIKAKFAYLYVERNGGIYFIADSETEDSKDYSPPGQLYSEAKVQDKQPFIDGKELVTNPLTDRWGTWVSVLIPIKDEASGKIVAVFGMDFNAKLWANSLFFEIFQSTILIILLLTVLFISARIRAKNKSLKTEIAYRLQADEVLFQSRERARFQRNAIARIAVDETISYGDLVPSFHRLTEEVTEAMQVERASIWLFSEDRTVLRCLSLHEKTLKKHSSGAILNYSDYPQYFEAINHESRISASDARKDPRTSEFAGHYLVPLGITSMLDAAIQSGGELKGVVCFEHTGEIRTWYSDEESFASTAASIVAQTLANRQRKLAEDALRIKDWAIESAISAIAISDLKGNLKYVNPAFLKLWGYSSVKEVLEKSPTSFWQMDEKTNEILKYLLTRHSLSTDLVAKNKDGYLFDVHLEASVVLDAEGLPHSLLASFEDITERKKMIASLEEALVKAESGNRLKTAFINNISHEIRTPLNGIIGFSNLLVNPNISNEDKALFYSSLESSSNRLMSTIDSYMDISLIASGNMELKPEITDLDSILFELKDQYLPMCKTKDLDLQLEISENPEEVSLRTDPMLFRKVMTHLLDNAIKFTQKGKITFGYTTRNESVEFFVKDTGIGISQESHTLIFESFIQEELSRNRAHEGSGLGLSIAQGIIQLLGGEIRAESKKDVGSIFIFTLPYPGFIATTPISAP